MNERVVRTHCVDPLIRGLIGRAGAIECQTGRTVRKSPVGAVSRGFLTESSRTRAAGNSIRCPCTTGTIGLSHATTRGQRTPSRGVFDVSHTGTLGTLPTRQADVTARGNARGVSSKPEEPCHRGPYALPRSSNRTNSASPNMGRILRIPRRRTPCLFSNLSLVDSFELN